MAQHFVPEYVLKDALQWLQPLGYEDPDREDLFEHILPELEEKLVCGSLTPTERKCLRNFLSCLGFDVGQTLDHSVGCERLGTRVATPCQERTCPLHIESSIHLNCLIPHSSIGLKPDSIAKVLSRDPKTFLRTLRSGILHLQQMLELERLREESLPEFEVLFLQSTCINCFHVAIPDFRLPGQDKIQELVYCSVLCWVSKPPLEVFLEKEFQIPAEEALLDLSRRYLSISDLAESLGFPLNQILLLSQKFGLSLQSPSTEKKRLRRTISEFITIRERLEELAMHR